MAALFRTVQTVATAVESSLDADGVSVLQSNGAAAGQDVFHAHVHVLLRYENDEVTLEWPTNELSASTGRELVETIRDDL